MKKLLLLALFTIASIGTFAQTFSYGVKAGLNISDWSVNIQGQSTTAQSLTGFHVGGLVDARFGSFSIQPGVFYTTKGASEKTALASDGPSAFTTTSKAKLNYLEIPVNFLYRKDIGKGNVFVGAGPYIAFGLSGKSTTSSTLAGQARSDTEDLKFGNGDDELKNPDIGLNGLLGYQLNNGLMISAGYGIGFTNLAHSDDGKIKNESFQFSLGYFFK